MRTKMTQTYIYIHCMSYIRTNNSQINCATNLQANKVNRL
jgi:hypothetical protein